MLFEEMISIKLPSIGFIPYPTASISKAAENTVEGILRAKLTNLLDGYNCLSLKEPRLIYILGRHYYILRFKVSSGVRKDAVNLVQKVMEDAKVLKCVQVWFEYYINGFFGHISDPDFMVEGHQGVLAWLDNGGALEGYGNVVLSRFAPVNTKGSFLDSVEYANKIVFHKMQVSKNLIESGKVQLGGFDSWASRFYK